MLFRTCPWEALEEIARWMRRRKLDDEAGYIERWVESVRPRSGNAVDADAERDGSIALEFVKRPVLANGTGVGDDTLGNDSDAL